VFSTSSSAMTILNKQSKQTLPDPEPDGAQPAPAKSLEPLTRKNVPVATGKNQPFATIAQIRPWNPVDRAR